MVSYDSVVMRCGGVVIRRSGGAEMWGAVCGLWSVAGWYGVVDCGV